MTEVNRQSNLTSAAGAMSQACLDPTRHYACIGNAAAWNHEVDQATDCGCLCHVPAGRLSHNCQDERWHSGCVGSDAAWDFVLDRAVMCECNCHRPSAVHARSGHGRYGLRTGTSSAP